MRYIVVSPIRNEEATIEKTIRSVLAQTVKPVEWIIVNDGSTDNSANIIAPYERKHPWIRVFNRADRGYRKPGYGVMEAFYHGYDNMSVRDWDFIAKLDGDLSFDRRYFERCLTRLQQNPEIGIAGGTIMTEVDTELRVERKDPIFHVRGASKIYRRECWFAIGGLIRSTGWDTVDELKALMLGWKVQTFSDICVVHHRTTGEADGAWRNWVKNGVANYVSGYHPLFMLSKCLKRLVKQPYLVQSAGLFCGYFSGYLKKVPRISDPALIRYLREQQLNKLLMRNSIWQY